jgi:hypothetical protein
MEKMNFTEWLANETKNYTQEMAMNDYYNEGMDEYDSYFSSSEYEDGVEKLPKIEDTSWDTPLNTEYIKDKKMDYEALGLITLFSFHDNGEKYRYLYEKGINSLNSNIDEMEKMSKNKRRNIRRAIKKLEECNNDVVALCEDDKGRMYYKISPYASDKDEKGRFVTINSKMLEYLISTSNSNVIKTYCAIKILLWDNKNQCYIKRPLTRDFLLKFIGLSVNENNLQQMSQILKFLSINGFIEREKHSQKVKVGGEIRAKDTYMYQLTTFDEWDNAQKELGLGVTKLLRSEHRKK